MAYHWDRIVGSIVWGRARSALIFGLPPEELMGVGRRSAFSAEQSWREGAGRSLSSWVYLNVERAVRKALVSAGRHAAEDDEAETDADADVVFVSPPWRPAVGVSPAEPRPDAQYLVREALNYLEAHLPREDWVLLWLHHAEGRNCKELAASWGIGHSAMRKRISRARTRAVTLWRRAA